MIARLPGWVWGGAWVLAFVAGCVNVVGLLSFAHLPVTHLTATASHFAEAAVWQNWHLLRWAGGLIASFVAGAMFSGWLIRGSALELGRSYGVALLIEAAALTIAVPLLQAYHPLGIALCCFAAGLQNALASTFSGAIIRTTHLTGLFTDMGVHLGQIARGGRPDWRRLCLFLTLISGFMGGGAFASWVGPYWGARTLWLPAGVLAVAAIGYGVLQRMKRYSVA